MTAPEVSSISVVTLMRLLGGLFLLPVALFQAAGQGSTFGTRDIIAVALGLSAWEVTGGALIPAAGVLVVVRGAGEPEPEAPL